jgi:hypothetical protein
MKLIFRGGGLQWTSVQYRQDDRSYYRLSNGWSLKVSIRRAGGSARRAVPRLSGVECPATTTILVYAVTMIFYFVFMHAQH